jgi:hypothetical protein
MPERRFPPPWSVEEQDACFVVRDHDGQQLAYVYFEEEPGRRAAAKLLTKEGACSSPAMRPKLQAVRNPGPRYKSRTGAGDIHRISKRGCDMRTTGLRFTFVQIAKCKAGLPSLVIDNKPRPRKHFHIVVNGLNGASFTFVHFPNSYEFKESLHS